MVATLKFWSSSPFVLQVYYIIYSIVCQEVFETFFIFFVGGVENKCAFFSTHSQGLCFSPLDNIYNIILLPKSQALFQKIFYRTYVRARATDD